MLSHARIMFRKLRGSGSRSSRGSEPAPSAPATTAESETVDPSPRAIHISDLRRPHSPTKLPSDSQFMSIIVVNAKGAADSLHLYRREALRRVRPTDDFTTDYFCDGYLYNICFIPSSNLGQCSAYLCLMKHFCLIFTYDASSRESWNEMVTACERMRSRCEEDRILPFLATMIAAMGEGEATVSHAEAKAFATQRDCLFVKVSPATGRGICDAVSSLVELAHGARDQYAMDQEGYTQRYKRAEALQALFPARDAQLKTGIIMDERGTAAKTVSKYSKYIWWDAAHMRLVRRRSPVTSLASLSAH
ncbi:uncharacterized protein NFIA_077120 [Aspergillus fischeri NRRL 181]|uniref:Uncharacterized protein n=1 Tax=Neosartorya fischeri (strain ATCC 1020 / DSM 3700 / CBS 544.65 / FGSC A1164 / JCM 1740 / NRRL 181 / WB 181) TaxID=331117 RepID=A1DEH2_NEOFI|nr:conserved hypothetical protein [Aspergillus fischeri NRRL 181]EAW17779.1 conserved hypothetical protein [Aspergillus fischeri NRRL 181]